MRAITALASLIAAMLVAASAIAQENTTDEGAGAEGDAGADDVNMTFDGTVTSVTITSTAGSEVCWTVEGTGTIARTGLRWDTMSHAGVGADDNATAGDGNTTVADANATMADEDATADAEAGADAELYTAGEAFPGDELTANETGYALPGTFCANVTAAQDETVFVVAFAEGADGELVASEETAVTVTAAADEEDEDGFFDPGANDTLGDEQEAVGEEDTPGVGLVAALAVAGLAAVALRRRK